MGHADFSESASTVVKPQYELTQSYPGLNVEPGPITHEIPGLGGSPVPNFVQESGEPNFCGMNLLKEAQKDLFTVPREEPIGIDEWQQTDRGNALAKQALGTDSATPASDAALNDWINKRSEQIELEFRQLYGLPVGASNAEVVQGMLNDKERGGRFCVLSQGEVDPEKIYNGAKRDAITQELVDKYQEKN